MSSTSSSRPTAFWPGCPISPNGREDRAILKPGGIFYIAEEHPFGVIFEDDGKTAVQNRISLFRPPETGKIR